MATFESFDPNSQQASALTDALVVPNSGINIVPGSISFKGGTAQSFNAETGESETAQSASFYDGSIAELGIDPGILLTSGDGTPPQSNTQGGYTGTFEESGQGDPDLQAVADAAFESSGETQDVSFLEFSFTVDNNLTQKGVQFDLVFGSDEFPEFSDSPFVDVAGVFLNGENVALFNDNENQPLSVISENLEVGNFRNNGSSSVGVPEGTPSEDIPIEYDGVSSRVKIVGPLQPGENTIKIGIADTGDQALDSGLFVSNLTTSATGGGGLLSTVPGTDGDDELTGTEANEFLDGGKGNDSLDPGGGNDVVAAGEGDDTIVGGNGDNNVDGGPGNDTVTYQATQAELPAVVIEGGAIQVGTNTDVLANVETLQFSDQSMATSDITGKDQIGKIYVGYFGRAPDPEGLNYWLGQLNQLESDGMSREDALDQIANRFADSQEATELFPFLESQDPARDAIEDFVGSVFDNLFNRTPESAGLEYWSDQIADGLSAGGGEGEVIQDIISGAQNSQAALDATAVQNKSQVALLFAEELDEVDGSLDSDSDVQTARDIVADVTSEASTVEDARDAIESFVGQPSSAASDPADLFA